MRWRNSVCSFLWSPLNVKPSTLLPWLPFRPFLPIIQKSSESRNVGLCRKSQPLSKYQSFELLWIFKKRQRITICSSFWSPPGINHHALYYIFSSVTISPCCSKVFKQQSCCSLSKCVLLTFSWWRFLLATWTMCSVQETTIWTFSVQITRFSKLCLANLCWSYRAKLAQKSDDEWTLCFCSKITQHVTLHLISNPNSWWLRSWFLLQRTVSQSHPDQEHGLVWTGFPILSEAVESMLHVVLCSIPVPGGLLETGYSNLLFSKFHTQMYFLKLLLLSQISDHYLYVPPWRGWVIS